MAEVKKEWITPVLSEERIVEETMHNNGSGNDGFCGTAGTYTVGCA